MDDVITQRPPVGADLLDVEDFQPMAREQTLCREQ